MKHSFANQVRRATVWAVFVLVACFFTANGIAQTAGAGNIQGTVADSTGAVIPGAQVTATEASTQVAHVATTDAAGAYTFPNLVVGSYSIKVVAQGFQTYTSTGNVLEVGANISVNAPMTVGASDQKVEVHSEGLALQTEDVSFKQTVDSQTITEMPLNGRQMTSLITLSGGSTPAPGGRLHGQQVLLPDHRCVDRRFGWQHDSVEAGRRRQQRLHVQRQLALPFPRRGQPVLG